MAKILIIEDDQDIIYYLTMILEGNGHTIAVKIDTENLSEDVRTINPNLIILDIMFPEDSQAGFKAAKILLTDKSFCKIPVIIFSIVNPRSNLSFSFSKHDIDIDFIPVDAFIEKPVEPKVLLSKIDRMLHSE